MSEQDEKPAAQRIVVKFFLRNGAVVDWPVPNPEQFNFFMLVKAVRADGHFIAADLYIPHEHIVTMGLGALPITLPQRGKMN